MITGSSLTWFLNWYEICLYAAQLNFDFKLTSDAKIVRGTTVAFDFARHGHALVTLYVQFLCSYWSKFDRWGHAENFDSWSWQSFMSTLCNVFNCLFPLDVQNAAVRSLLLFMASLFIGFLVEKYFTCQSRKSDFGWHCFRFWPCLMRKRVEKSAAILALLDTFQELHLKMVSLTNQLLVRFGSLLGCLQIIFR